MSSGSCSQISSSCNCPISRVSKDSIGFLKEIFGFSGGNSKQTVKQPKEVFSRKHRAHCLKAVPGYWCKIAKHCKQILLPVIVNCWLHRTPHGKKAMSLECFNREVVDRWRERTKIDRVTLRLASATDDMVEFGRVWDRIKPIIRNKTDKCSKHNPNIGPLTDLHTRWHSSYFSSMKRSSYKNASQWATATFQGKMIGVRAPIIFHACGAR